MVAASTMVDKSGEKNIFDIADVILHFTYLRYCPPCQPTMIATENRRNVTSEVARSDKMVISLEWTLS